MFVFGRLNEELAGARARHTISLINMDIYVEPPAVRQTVRAKT